MSEKQVDRIRKIYLEALERKEKEESVESEALKKDIYKRYSYVLESINHQIESGAKDGRNYIMYDFGHEFGYGFIRAFVSIYKERGFKVELVSMPSSGNMKIAIFWD